MKLQKYFSKHNSLFTAVFFTRQQNRKLHCFTPFTEVNVSNITVFATCAINGDDVLKSCLTLGEEGVDGEKSGKYVVYQQSASNDRHERKS